MQNLRILQPDKIQEDRRDIPKEEIFGFFHASEKISYNHRVYPKIEENNAKRLGTEYYTCTV